MKCLEKRRNRFSAKSGQGDCLSDQISVLQALANSTVLAECRGTRPGGRLVSAVANPGAMFLAAGQLM